MAVWRTLAEANEVLRHNGALNQQAWHELNTLPPAAFNYIIMPSPFYMCPQCPRVFTKKIRYASHMQVYQIQLNQTIPLTWPITTVKTWTVALFDVLKWMTLFDINSKSFVVINDDNNKVAYEIYYNLWIWAARRFKYMKVKLCTQTVITKSSLLEPKWRQLI